MTANYWKHHHLLPPKEITGDCRYMNLIVSSRLYPIMAVMFV